MTTADAGARLRIRDDLEQTMVVVAGAGTGKTTELVERIVKLVGSGVARLRDVAAITFTEAAAAELRERIRSALVEASNERTGDRLILEALDEVDEAAISTLHAFAQRMLLEHCAAAGLPSGFEVLDDTADAVDFDARWVRFADRLLEDPAAEPALVRGFTTGLRHTDLRSVARALHDNWDRLEDAEHTQSAQGVLLAPPGEPGGLHGPGVIGVQPSWPRVRATRVLNPLETALDLAHCCSEEYDNLLAHLRLVVADARAQLVAAGDDEEAVLNLLANLPFLRCNLGRQENWGGRIEEVRAACATAEAERTEILTSVRRTVLGDLVPRLITFVLESASERRAEGRLTFHDLLVHARRLLRGGGEPVEALRRRYRWILVDEFQDTDPIQVELAARLACESEGGDDLASARPGGLFVVGDPKQSIYRFRRADIDLFDRVGSEIGERIVLLTNFRSVPGILDFVNVVFGELFGTAPVVGQARHHELEGARPALPDDLSEDKETRGGKPEPARPGPAGSKASRGSRGSTAGAAGVAHGETRSAVQLSFDNLRSEDPVPEDSEEVEATETAGARQPSATATASSRGRTPVVLLGNQLEGSVSEIRRRAANDAAACIRTMIDDRWPVADPEDGRARAPRFADVAVLIPTRTSLSSLEEAFEEAGVPYRVEGASMLWGTEDVADVLAVLRAVDDPADEISLLAALRSPGLGCGDDDLVGWQAAGGRWDLRGKVPEGLEDHPVARAMAVLDALHEKRWWTSPSRMVADTVEDLRSFTLAYAHRRPRDHWHRLRWLCDQARLFDETSGGTLRSFLRWAQVQAESDGGARGVGPPDPDDDAVRVMTIHGAKGLEFPVVVLAGLERQDSDGHQLPAVLWTEDGSLEVKAGVNFRTQGYDEAGARDQDLDNLERRRLLYVGMTRARDHLVICAHHRARNSGSDSSLASRLVEICEAHPHLWRRQAFDPKATSSSRPWAGAFGAERAASEGSAGSVGASGAGAESDAHGWRAFVQSWETDRRELIGTLTRQPVTSATAIGRSLVTTQATETRASASQAKELPRTQSLRSTPARRGPETALRIGRVVHGVLSGIDLATGLDMSGRGVDELSRSSAVANGISTRAGSIASMARRALDSPEVRRAATRRHWKEMYVGIPVDFEPARGASQGLVEGFADLVFEDDDGLVVVDYKTDELGDSDDLDEHLERYSDQLGVYAAAIETSCGMPVSRCTLIFVGARVPAERTLSGRELETARRSALALAATALAG